MPAKASRRTKSSMSSKPPQTSRTPPDLEMSEPNTAPDSFIKPADSIAYWSSTAATVTGMLGGFPQVSRIDLQGSRNFLAKLRRSTTSTSTSPSTITETAGGSAPLPRLNRVVDIGAGIGRITLGFLSHVANEVDVVEPVQKFTNELRSEKISKEIEDHGAKLGRIFNVGLEDWKPRAASETESPDQQARTYDLVWAQWCLGHLPDSSLSKFLESTIPHTLTPETGLLVIKENLSTHRYGEDEFDTLDSSVTRSEEKFRTLIQQAGLEIVKFEIQKGFPKGLGLLPVAMFGVRVPMRNNLRKGESEGGEEHDGGERKRKTHDNGEVAEHHEGGS